MKKLFLAGFALFTFMQTSFADSTLPDIKEGLWELSFKSDITAMPTTMPSIAYNSEHCLNRKTAGDPHTLLQNNNCEISNLNQQANQVTWDMRCLQQGIQMTGSGKVNYSHESFTGIFNMTMQSEGAGAMSIVTQTSGRYKGSCQ